MPRYQPLNPRHLVSKVLLNIAIIIECQGGYEPIYLKSELIPPNFQARKTAKGSFSTRDTIPKVIKKSIKKRLHYIMK